MVGLSIGICGGGIGGLAAAIALQKFGHRVKVFEKATALNRVGADINLTPMTFGWADGKVYMFGRGQKIANLRRSSTATVLVDIGDTWKDIKGVMMRGHARVLESAADEAADSGLEAARANISAKHGLERPYDATAIGNSRRWIVFEPGKVVSWDNSKLS